MAKTSDPKSSDESLGAHLTRLRRHWTLIAPGRGYREGSLNAYLSQSKTTKCEPSPHILHALAVVYKTSYDD